MVMVSTATGVFMVPVIPYIQALGLGRDDMVQAQGRLGERERRHGRDPGTVEGGVQRSIRKEAHGPEQPGERGDGTCDGAIIVHEYLGEITRSGAELQSMVAVTIEGGIH